MHARVVGKFGMEGGSHDSSLPYSNRIAAIGGKHFYVRPYTLNFRSTDKNHLQRRVSQLAGADGAVDLAAIGVAPNADVERTQALLPGILHFVGQKDCTRAGAKCRLDANELFQFFKSGFPQQVKKS